MLRRQAVLLERDPLPLIVLTPEVFLLPLSLVSTPTLDGALLAFKFFGTLAFVSTTPLRVALAFEFVFESPPPHAATTSVRTARTRLATSRAFCADPFM